MMLSFEYFYFALITVVLYSINDHVSYFLFRNFIKSNVTCKYYWLSSINSSSRLTTIPMKEYKGPISLTSQFGVYLFTIIFILPFMQYLLYKIAIVLYCSPHNSSFYYVFKISGQLVCHISTEASICCGKSRQKSRHRVKVYCLNSRLNRGRNCKNRGSIAVKKAKIAVISR